MSVAAAAAVQIAVTAVEVVGFADWDKSATASMAARFHSA